ncbi:hypothetical protein LSH36_11g02057 [Paralvinella palmiformis]|uniref:Charged multivesicular body protein 1b n=1 Tax=Paralvinella palmiformis TaxID=53620 RepID=A0AAD9KEI8_9ANNE|nr:hypothetical protein LSH36_11g02057 [Paralvinella palmiformis]
MSTKQMEKHLFNLKFAAKDLERNAKKSEKSEKEEKNKLKKAIQKGNMEGAKIHGENAIRQKNQALNYRRMSARVDAVAARVQTAVTMKQVTGSMAGVVKAMESAMKGMNLEKSQVMEDTMCASSTLATPQNQVDSLMQEVADEAGLELNMDLPQAQSTSVGASTQASQEQFEYKSNFKQAHSTELQFGKSFPSVADVSEVFDYSVKDYT